MIGNLLEHYDRALFGLLAPFIAPLFFEEKDPLTALILTYGMLPLGILSRPLGSLFFGWIGDRFGRREALFYSLLGMALATIGIGCLPTYSQIGIGAPLCLALGRLLQNFFDAGEASGGAIFLLENTIQSKRSFFSSIYDVSTIAGILAASGLVALFSQWGWVENGWRVLFWIGGATALFGVFLRLQMPKSPAAIPANAFQILKKEKGPLLRILFASGFSYTTYAIPCILMNGFIPLVTSIEKSELMRMNTALLAFDLFLLPIFGLAAMKWGKERMMISAAFFAGIGAIPFFCCLDGASIGTVVLVRMAIVALGVAFAAPYHAWALEQVPVEHRFTVLSFGSALGSQLIGAPCSAVCLWLFQTLEWIWAPGLYLLAAGAAACLAVAKRKPLTQPLFDA